MPLEMRVADIMQKEFNAIAPDASIRDAVESLYSFGEDEGHAPISQSLVVIESDGDLAGVMTMFDILRAVEPPYLRDRAPLAGIAWEGFFKDVIHQAKTLKVCDVMTPWSDVRSVAPGDRLIKALELMANGHVRRLPVCEGRQVVGVIRLFDIFQEVAREMLAAGGDEKGSDE